MPGVNAPAAVDELVRATEFLAQKVERLVVTANALNHAILMAAGALADAQEAARAVKTLGLETASSPAADAGIIAQAISDNTPAESGRSLNS